MYPSWIITNAEMVFDPTPIEPDKILFELQDWLYSAYGYEDLKEEMPSYMPVPHSQSMTMRVFVDADHAGDLVTCQSRTGFIVFLNKAPIYWSLKKQNSCETSTFGSELVAMKQATEYVQGLQYKLRMMGIKVDEPTFVFGDNQSVLCNTTAPASTLKKKSNAITYHFVREGFAQDEWRTANINTDNNGAVHYMDTHATETVAADVVTFAPTAGATKSGAGTATMSGSMLSRLTGVADWANYYH